MMMGTQLQLKRPVLVLLLGTKSRCTLNRQIAIPPSTCCGVGSSSFSANRILGHVRLHWQQLTMLRVPIVFPLCFSSSFLKDFATATVELLTADEISTMHAQTNFLTLTYTTTDKLVGIQGVSEYGKKSAIFLVSCIFNSYILFIK